MALKRNAPHIPYRKLTEEEQQKLWAYARKLKDSDDFWKQTTEEARKVLRTIAQGGFVVGGELEWRTPMEGYGCHSHIYSRGYAGRDVKEVCNYHQVIASVDLWEAGGFISTSVKLWYQNPKVLDGVFELRDYLARQDISFADCIDIQDLRREVSNLETARAGKLEILSRLKGVALRID